MTITEFKIPMCIAPYFGERKLRVEMREVSRARHRTQGVREPRHVYFLGCDESPLIKIGSAFDIELRLEEIQRMSPVKLRILGYIPGVSEAVERALHECFREGRKHGEWFDLDFAELESLLERTFNHPIVVRP